MTGPATLLRNVVSSPGQVTHAMALAHVQSSQYSGVGAVSESAFYTRWGLLRAFFPRLCIRNTWGSRLHFPKDVMVPTELSVLGDADDSGFISDLDYSPSGRLLVASSSSNSLFVLDPNRGSVVKTFYKPHKDSISKVQFVGEYQFVSGSADSTIGYWDIRHPEKPLNFLSRHTRPIRSLQYLASNNYLISSCQDGAIRFWHLPTYAVELQKDDTDDSLVHGILLKCPNINQCYFSESQGMAVISNHDGSVFVLHNLSVSHIREDLGNLVLDGSSYMQLFWFKPDATPGKRNRVTLIDNSEYSPIQSASVSNMAHLSIHPSFPVSLMRITTLRSAHVSREVKEWTCVCRLKEQVTPSTNDLAQYMQLYGSNVMDGMLLYATEEKRYASFREKQPSFSMCGRVIASPDVEGVRLLKFSLNMGTCSSPILLKNPASMDCVFQPSNWLTPLEEVTRLPGPHKSVLCCKFSPSDQTLLAVGDSDGQISFYHPKL